MTHAWHSPLRRYREGRYVPYGKAINIFKEDRKKLKLYEIILNNM